MLQICSTTNGAATIDDKNKPKKTTFTNLFIAILTGESSERWLSRKSDGMGTRWSI
jgi:hypothetical protein